MEGLGDLSHIVDNDVPFFAGLDTMKLSHGRLGQAEQAAAELWGADHARFSSGGSTHANQAALLAVRAAAERCLFRESQDDNDDDDDDDDDDGDDDSSPMRFAVVVPRTAHRSVLLGLVLAGLEPIWVMPSRDEATGLPLGITAEDLEATMDRFEEEKRKEEEEKEEGGGGGGGES